jgi:uncharacterized protein (DUF427 family)
MSTKTIHRRNAPEHFMRIKPVAGKIKIERNGQVLAASSRALRLTEMGHDLYDPVFYIPKSDVSAELVTVPGKTTHCPLKGDACYFTLDEEEPIAWSYDRPMDYSEEIRDFIAFYGNKVTISETGTEQL